MAILKNTTITTNGFVKYATGTSAQREGSPTDGGVRFNSDRNEVEVYNGSRWTRDADQQQPEIVTNNLINYFDPALGESYPGTGNTWFDLSGNENNASLTNVGYSSEAGGSLSFNGSTSYAYTDNTVPSLGSHTVMMWVKARVPLAYSESSSPRRTPYKTPGSAGWTPGLWMTGRIIRPHAQSNYRDLRINWMDTGWHLLGQVWDGSRVQVIVDGTVLVPPHSNQSGNFYSTTDSRLAIGSETNGSSANCWDGLIGAVMIYDRALSRAEVDQNYAAMAKRYGVSTKGTRKDPAESASELKKHRPLVTNGFYYINQTGGSAQQHFCVFYKSDGRTEIEGGPWTCAFRSDYDPANFSTNGPTAMKTFQDRCYEIGVKTPGRGMESRRGSTAANGAWLAVKRAIHEGYPLFVDGRSSGGGGTIAMPLMNINGEGGSSDHRCVYDPTESAQIAPNENADVCNANQLFCGWWGATDIGSWTTDNDGLPGPEDWGPPNGGNGTFGGDGLSPMLLACVYK